MLNSIFLNRCFVLLHVGGRHVGAFQGSACRSEELVDEWHRVYLFLCQRGLLMSRVREAADKQEAAFPQPSMKHHGETAYCMSPAVLCPSITPTALHNSP